MALLLILASMIFVMAAPDGRWSDVIILILEGGALFASLRAAQSGYRLRLFCGVTIGIALVGAIGLSALGEDGAVVFAKWASLLLVLLAAPVISVGLIRQVKEKQAITLHTMMGVLCIYLLMAISFASSYALINEMGAEPFFRHGDGGDTLSNYLYFSLTTITTAGLGDFAPATDLGRSLTAAEALIGQIYLVTVVAVIVGNLGRKR
ncbi:MAG: potassium channel family protein [Solirubrobacterales bacterium]